MLFADDIVLVDESCSGVNRKLELWRQTLESKGFRLSRMKTEYMHCNFSEVRGSGPSGEVTLDGVEIKSSTKFRYLGSIVQFNGELDDDVEHRIKAGWFKWKKNYRSFMRS